MKIKIKKLDEVQREDAHGGEGARRLYLDTGELKNDDFQAMTLGYLQPGKKFSWHSHEQIEEVMLVLNGSGIVRDKDGEYEYEIGDLFVFPADVEHEIENTSNFENDFIFFRIKK